MTDPRPDAVYVAANAIPAGFTKDLNGLTSLSITLTVEPRTQGSGSQHNPGRFSLKNWPMTICELMGDGGDDHAHGSKIGIKVAPVGKAGESLNWITLVADLSWPPPTKEMQKRILDFWQRMMASDLTWPSFVKPWDEYWSVLDEACANEAQRPPDIMFPTPHSEAALAFTLERGRHLLNAIASPSGNVNTLNPTRPAIADIVGRPWFGGKSPDPGLVQLASLERVSDAPSLSIARQTDEWQTPFRAATSAALEGRVGTRLWSDPNSLVSGALGRNGGLGQAIDRIHAAHHFATPLVRLPKSCAAESNPADIARRCLAALMGLPSLQRLVGFAIDVTIPMASLPRTIINQPYVWVAPDIKPDNGDSWSATLACLDRKGERSSFMPATRSEAAGEAGTTDQKGVVFLGRVDASGPLYDICTVDPVLATESDINRRGSTATANTSTGSATGAQTLRFGGLRLVTRDTVSHAIERIKRPSCSTGGPLLLDADDIEVGVRLLVGLKTKSGHAWRSPQFRTISYRDPRPKGHPKDWVEVELARRLGPPNGRRRIALDAATISIHSQTHIDPDDLPSPNEPPPPFPLQDGSPPTIDDVSQATLKVIAESTIAAWGGAPMGVPPASKGRFGKPISYAVVEELEVSRLFLPPSRDFGCPNDVLSPELRFGWAYHLALARVFPAGVSISLEDAHASLKSLPGAALPSIGRQDHPYRGRSFLRHERVSAPLVYIPDVDFKEIMNLKPSQSGAAMVVRSSKSDPPIQPTEAFRILVPPSVDLAFAILHDVFNGISQRTQHVPQGLQGVTLPITANATGSERSHPSRMRVGHPHPGERESRPYFPDPAASNVVLRLCVPDSPRGPARSDREVPILLEITNTWPNVLPIYLALRRGKTDQEQRLRNLGRRWLGPGEILQHESSNQAVPVQLVEVVLEAGEDMEVQAWCVPTIQQLAKWFDPIEAAGLLAVHDGLAAEQDDDIEAACGRGLLSLLGVSSLPTTQTTSSLKSPEICTGACGLSVPPPEQILSIAGLVYSALLASPISLIAAPLSIRVTHAVDQSLVPAPTMDLHDCFITRRHFLGGDAGGGRSEENRLDFLTTKSPTDWGLLSCEEGAVGALIGGAISIDCTSTGAIEIEVECVAPLGELIDDVSRGRTSSDQQLNDWPSSASPSNSTLFGFRVREDHTVDLAQRGKVIALRLDGLPLPPDGIAGLRSYRLEQLQAAALGERKPLGSSLRLSLPAALTSPGARSLRIRAIALNRHQGLMPGSASHDEGESVGSISAAIEIQLPATVRPSPPLVSHVQLGIVEEYQRQKGIGNTLSVTHIRSTQVRVWLKRPWFSSGEGERLGIVLWPPALFTRGVAPALTDQLLGTGFMDSDLGPGGAYVTRCGAHAYSEGLAPTGPFIEAEAFGNGGDKVSYAQMPLTDESSINASALQSPPSTKNPEDLRTSAITPTTYLAVALQTYVPRFHPTEELWYVDINIKLDPIPFPRLRLGLVRYQPNAREDESPFEDTEPVRLRVSTPVTQWIQLLPGRVAKATRTIIGGETQIYVTIEGPSSKPFAGAEQGGPTFEIEFLRIKDATGDEPKQEETVLDKSGLKCNWRSWKSDKRGLGEEFSGGWRWSCVFTMDSSFSKDKWRHAILVRETHKEKPANEDSTGAALIEAGENFIALLEFTD